MDRQQHLRFFKCKFIPRRILILKVNLISNDPGILAIQYFFKKIENISSQKSFSQIFSYKNFFKWKIEFLYHVVVLFLLFHEHLSFQWLLFLVNFIYFCFTFLFIFISFFNFFELMNFFIRFIFIVYDLQQIVVLRRFAFPMFLCSFLCVQLIINLNFLYIKIFLNRRKRNFFLNNLCSFYLSFKILRLKFSKHRCIFIFSDLFVTEF